MCVSVYVCVYGRTPSPGAIRRGFGDSAEGWRRVEECLLGFLLQQVGSKPKAGLAMICERRELE